MIVSKEVLGIMISGYMKESIGSNGSLWRNVGSISATLAAMRQHP